MESRQPTLESMGLETFYKGKRVFVTGHTGFKGAWLCLFLQQLGAEVYGYSLPPQSGPNLFHFLSLSKKVNQTLTDLSDRQALQDKLSRFSPDIVFHMASQALVIPSYENPLETLQTNVMGTAYLLEACRSLASLSALIVVTSDKCYSPSNTKHAFVEDDPLGGPDPYSCSKSMQDLLAQAYCQSFFNHQRIATARAGNVIGGGDFSDYRLIPDMIRSIESNTPLLMRAPEAIRPWQHVFDVLHGYLSLGKAVSEQPKTFSSSFNFGPSQRELITVKVLTQTFLDILGYSDWRIEFQPQDYHESNFLDLDTQLAQSRLKWVSHLSTAEAISMTADWYRHYLSSPETLSSFSLDQVSQYLDSLNLDLNQE